MSCWPTREVYAGKLMWLLRLRCTGEAMLVLYRRSLLLDQRCYFTRCFRIETRQTICGLPCETALSVAPHPSVPPSIPWLQFTWNRKAVEDSN